MTERRRGELPALDDWTIEEALAIYDFCARMTDVLWASHGDELLERMLQRPDHGGFVLTSCAGTEENLELPFDDEPPF